MSYPSIPTPLVGTITNVGGRLATYVYAVQATAPYATPTDWVVIRGAASKIVKIQRIDFSGGATAATELMVSLKKHTIANTGGTSTNPVATQHDSADAAASALVLLYSVAPSIDASATLWKTIRMDLDVLPAASAATPDRFMWESTGAMEPLVLRGAAQEFAVNFASVAVPSGGVYDLAITWTEE